MRTRTLRLAKETLTDLTPAELDLVAGAYPTGTLTSKCVSGLVFCLTGQHCLPTLDGCFTGTTTTG
jgi:hypothetical protein